MHRESQTLKHIIIIKYIIFKDQNILAVVITSRISYYRHSIKVHRKNNISIHEYYTLRTLFLLSNEGTQLF